MLALLPNPAPIGIVERKVYIHAGDLAELRDRYRYKNERADDWCILRICSGCFGDMLEI